MPKLIYINGLAILLSSFLAYSAYSSVATVKGTKKLTRLTGELGTIRNRVIDMEQKLIDDLQTQKRMKSNMKRIQELIRLQKQERLVGNKRLKELEDTVKDLESRRASLNEKVLSQQSEIRKFLRAISAENSQTSQLPESDRQLTERLDDELESPKRKMLANLVDHGLKEIEALKADLDDADQLEEHIQDEKQQLAYLLQDLKEQESVLELNRQLQVELLEKKHFERLAQLENYRKLKSSEAQVEQLITQFNARLELEHAQEAERQSSRMMMQGGFTKLKGKLPFPVKEAKVISAFGRAYDSKSRLYIFKKGIDLEGGKNSPVLAITSGKIAYSGDLPEYGRVMIIDHGDHFYSLCAHLGELKKKAGDLVTAGEAIGATDDSATPIYFEIRARNVAVNPLQWLYN